MNDNLKEEQIRLEQEMRDLGISRFNKENLRAKEQGNFSETIVASQFLKNYLIPFSKNIEDWLRSVSSGSPGRRHVAAKCLRELDTDTTAYLFTKAVLNKVPTTSLHKPCSFTSLAIYGAGLLHDELRLRHFEKNWRAYVRSLWADFDKRETLRHKRKEQVRRKFAEAQLEWEHWTPTQLLHIGAKLIEIFASTTGDIKIETHVEKKRQRTVVSPTQEMLDKLDKRHAGLEAVFTVFLPMVVPPLEMDLSRSSTGQYLTRHVHPYPLVKSSTRAYREQLTDEQVDHLCRTVNALSNTPWRVNKRVLEALNYVYGLNQCLAGLPSSDKEEKPPIPAGLLPDDRSSELSKEYRKQCFLYYDKERRSLSKRINVNKVIEIARRFSKYDAIYFPHDADSRGRLYPKPALLNPQGPDFAKGVLMFAKGEPLEDEYGVAALAFHGANCAGQDKLAISERVQWVHENEELILSCAENPLDDLRWTSMDAPFQFLAFCFEWAGYKKEGYSFISYLHVDVDATCSGLQHFSAMLRDEEGGRYVNLTATEERQDIYQRVADKALASIKADNENPELRDAWVKFGMSRSITKRSVMVVPYSGTFHACMQYTADAVQERLEEGEENPWPDDYLSTFTVYGAKHIWAAIEDTIVAATKAMKWISTLARLVGKSDVINRIEWTTPVGFPVHQRKVKLEARRVKTWFDGSVIKPSLTSQTDELDPRQMASSIAPSFVHSLDAAHMMLSINYAKLNGIDNFAAVHDSFGCHARHLSVFNACIREAFVDIYEQHDVILEFYTEVRPLISDEYLEDVPPIPQKGTLDIHEVLDSEFFFS